MSPEQPTHEVLAALDASAAAGAVLDTAVRVGRLTDSTVVAVHVRSDPAVPVDVVASLAEERGIALRVLDGDPGPTLIEALRGPEAIAAVIGGSARSVRPGPGACRVSRTILEQSDGPVVVVPPDTGPHQEIRRLLLPLEGSEASSRAVLDQLVPLVATDIELEVLHVFTPATVPPMLDQPTYDLDTLGKEFLSRHCPGASRIEFRGGGVVDQVTRLSVDHHADLIVLTWSQSPSPRHAQVVRGVLAASSLPVLLLPVLAVAPVDPAPAPAAAPASGTITLVHR